MKIPFNPYSYIQLKKRTNKIVAVKFGFLLLTFYWIITWLPFGSLFKSKLEFVGSIESSILALNQGVRNLSQLLQTTCIYCPKEIYDCTDDPVIYFVTTPPQNFLQRSVIRETWGKDVKTIFLSGIIEDEEIMESAIKEAKLFRDVIIENFADTYVNLTIKTGFMLKHYLKLCTKSLYFMKADDDVFVNTNIIENIISERTKHDSLIGHVIHSSPPQRDRESKWYLPRSMYPEDIMPSFISGSYLVPSNLVETILHNAFNEPIINLEDVFYTGLIANEMCSIPLKNDKTFKTGKALINYYCLYKDLATIHRLTPSEMNENWLLLKRLKHQCYGFKYSILSFFFRFN